MELTTEQLHWLLSGIDIGAVRRHPGAAVSTCRLAQRFGCYKFGKSMGPRVWLS